MSSGKGIIPSFSALWGLLLFGFFLQILFDQFRRLPNGPGWLIVPIIGAVIGWKTGKGLLAKTELEDFTAWLRCAKLGRITLVVSILWLISWSIYAQDGELFNSYSWRIEDWIFYVVGCTFAPTVIAYAILTYRWINKGRPND